MPSSFILSEKGDGVLRKSFFHYLMKFREEPPRDELAEFANHAFHDHSFPKMASQYDELSRYLELNGFYLSSMAIFDEAWDRYIEEEKE
ncbi:YozE family protein [Pseudobacillus wudalianchiensis]|uniref:UPF0346 protein A8F95_03835 n=1 Tax=Pseudobacillus wudalianchiensis TaxID=1743143 RepID=A0A1B9BAA8_9BACI|nr:YozE family protein [Bacillus wudalianchiensis]OCA93012.1 hypothetical protein A8F95_03835 [Bacillus wudalianchiensis]